MNRFFSFFHFMKMSVLVLCIGIAASCATVQTDLFYTGTAGETNTKTLEGLETDIVLQYIHREPKKLANIQSELEMLLKKPSTDSSYLARLYALYADIFILKRQLQTAQKKLNEAKAYDAYDEYVQLVQARLIKDQDERKAYLEQRVTENTAYYRLSAELGGLYAAAKDYRNALAAFDASLAFLPDVYRQRYEKAREQSAQLYTLDAIPTTKSSEKILQSTSISLIDMAVLTQDSTTALDFITGTAEWKPPLLADHLKKAGWYNPESDILGGSTSKKDAALFLWHLVTGGDTKRLTKYSCYYANKRKLPIPDVPLDGVYFDSIIGTVEEDIIPLVDGKNFQPDTAVSGLEFYNWLLKADALR